MQNRLSGYALVALLFLAVSALPAAAQTTDNAPPVQTSITQTAPAQPQTSPPPAGPQATPPAREQPASAPGQEMLMQGVNDFRLGNYEEAFDELTKARAQDPQSSVAAYYLGVTLKKMQQFHNAIPHLMAAVTLQPPAKQAYLELADAYYVTDQLDPALRALDLAQKENIDPGQAAFLRGLVLVKKRAYAPALASFDQAKSIDPKLALACDYQIALIYARTGKQTEARDLFQAIAEKDAASDEGRMARQQADSLNARLKERKPFSGMANVQYQYDSNVVLKPDQSAAAQGISGQSDMVAVLALRAEYAPEVQLPYGAKFQYSGYLSSHRKLRTYDMQSHTLAVVPSYRMKENSASLPISFNYTLLDNTRYLQAYALTPTYSFAISDDQNAQVSILYQKKDFLQTPAFSAENQDATDTGFGLAWFRVIADQKGFLNIRYDLTKENATGANWSYLGNKLGGSMLYPFTEKIKLALGLEADRLDFDNVHTVFGIKRADTTYTASAQMLYALTHAFDGQLQYVWTQNDSNIPVYAYHKNVISVGVNARF